MSNRQPGGNAGHAVRRLVGPQLLILAGLAVLPLWAFYTVMLRRRPLEIDNLSLIFLLGVFGCAALAPAYLFESLYIQAPPLTWSTVAAPLYTGCFASAAAYWCWNRGAEMVGLGRWLRQAGQYDKALEFFRRAVVRGLPDSLLFRTLWDIAALQRKTGDAISAQKTLIELATCRNPFRASALAELAKHSEHRERSLDKALELTRAALQIEDTNALRQRESRLQRRIARARSNV